MSRTKTPKFAFTAAVLGAATLLSAAHFGCGSDESTAVARAKLAQGCLINSDCQEPLVCAYKSCHTQCNATRDCPAGQRCVTADKPFHVCQLPEEKDCSNNTDCPGTQVCGIDKQCRDACLSSRDCVTGQTCASGTCAEPSELTNDGGLPSVDPLTADAGSGRPCSHATDCPGDLVCLRGLCTFECLGDKDCSMTWHCGPNNRCYPPDGG